MKLNYNLNLIEISFDNSAPAHFLGISIMFQKKLKLFYKEAQNLSFCHIRCHNQFGLTLLTHQKPHCSEVRR